MRSLNNNSEKSLYVRVIELALEYPEGFAYSEIIDNVDLNLEEWEKNILDRNFFNACQRYHHNNNTIGETIFVLVHGNSDHQDSPENKYILTFETEFTFIDYLELKFARKNAKEAKRYSLIAIIISILAIIVSALIPFFVAKNINQSILINDNQYREIKDLLKSDKDR